MGVPDESSDRPSPAGLRLFGSNRERIERFVELLADEGDERGLVGPREIGRLWSRHILNSAALLQFVEPDEVIADVGSGAGFPGLVLAIARPDLEVHCIEPMQRRTEWLQYVVDVLELGNVVVHEARAEDVAGRLQADLVTARAVAGLSVLLPWVSALGRGGGRLALLKGRSVNEELPGAESLLPSLGITKLRVHEVVPCAGEPSTHVVAGRFRRDWNR